MADSPIILGVFAKAVGTRLSREDDRVAVEERRGRIVESASVCGIDLRYYQLEAMIKRRALRTEGNGFLP